MVPSFVLALVLAASSPSFGGTSALCRVTVRAGSARPAIAGPLEVVTRARIADQPESPLRIVRVDFTGTRVYRGDTVLEVERVVRIEVRNVSTRPLHSADIRIDIRTAEGTLVWRPRLTSTLRPGTRTTLRLDAARGRLVAFRRDGPFDVSIGISRAQLDSCTYESPRPFTSPSTPAAPPTDSAAS